MIYSNFYKKWIATCMKCSNAILNFNTIAYSEQMEIVFKQKYYDLDFLNKYFIIDDDYFKVRSTCGNCYNKNCKAYMKNQ